MNSLPHGDGVEPIVVSVCYSHFTPKNEFMFIVDAADTLCNQF